MLAPVKTPTPRCWSTLTRRTCRAMNVLAGIRLQRECERMAYELGGGASKAPAQLVGDFLCGIPSVRGGKDADLPARRYLGIHQYGAAPARYRDHAHGHPGSPRVAFVVSMTRKPCSPAWRRAPAPPSPWCATAPATPRAPRGSTLAARVRATPGGIMSAAHGRHPLRGIAHRGPGVGALSDVARC